LFIVFELLNHFQFCFFQLFDASLGAEKCLGSRRASMLMFNTLRFDLNHPTFLMPGISVEEPFIKSSSGFCLLL
jgi:hypothetical protein